MTEEYQIPLIEAASPIESIMDEKGAASCDCNCTGVCAAGYGPPPPSCSSCASNINGYCL